MAGTTRPASLARVERLEHEIKNLQRAFAAQTKMLVELRQQVAPVDRYAALDAQTRARASNGSPVVRNGSGIRL